MADLVWQYYKISIYIKWLSRTEEFTGELRLQKLSSVAPRAVEKQNSVPDVARRIAPGSAKGAIMKMHIS